MAEITVPELAESIMEGTIAQWLKKPGDYVEKGEYIVELETDKVNVEIISEEAGVVKELKAEEGETVQVGDVIAIVEAGASAGASEPAPAPTKEEAPQPAQTEQPKGQAQEEKQEEQVQTATDRPVASPASLKLSLYICFEFCVVN